MYTMRYVTVTAGEHSELFAATDYMLSDIAYLEDVAGVLGDAVLSYAGEKIIEKLLEEAVDLVPFAGEICSAISLIAEIHGVVTQNPFTLLDPYSLILRSGTAWTQSYIQIYNPSIGLWYTAQCSTYAVSSAHFDSTYIYNSETNAPEQVCGIVHNDIIYSPYYNYPEFRKERAVKGYLIDVTLHDCTGDITFSFTGSNGNILLFTHKECTLSLLPEYQEE